MAKMTAPAVRARKGGPKLTMITAYDTPSARIAGEAGADMVLVGDSVANVVLGHEDTLAIDMATMVHHTSAVARARIDSLIVGDMPWLSYHVSIEDAVRNAAALMRAGAGAVKLEGGAKRRKVIEAILDAEIPVMGHLGLTPQSLHAMGGYKVQGKAVDAARALVDDAIELAEAGVFSIVLEGIPDLLAEVVTKDVSVPTIGIGAGSMTDGQVLVFHDVLGLNTGHVPKFVRSYANLHSEAVEALQRFFSDVGSGAFPSEEETYHMPEEAAIALLGDRSDT